MWGLWRSVLYSLVLTHAGQGSSKVVSRSSRDLCVWGFGGVLVVLAV